MNRFPLGVWLFALALAAVTALPYVAGALNAPSATLYSGAALVPSGAAVDYNSHLAKMWQGRRGEWDYQLLFTHEAHPGLPLVQGFYTLLGALSPFDLALTYHLARFVLTIGMVLALWVFASHFFETPSARWICLLLSTISAGWSWLLLFVPGATAQVGPIEFWLIDAYNLIGALFMPHFAAAVILQIAAFLTFEAWVRSAGAAWRGLLLLTALLAAMGIVQPYIILLSLPLLLILLGYYVISAKLLTWRRALWLLLPLAAHTALIVYQYVAINNDAVWRSFSEQNITASPDLLYYILGYLPFIIPILIGARTFVVDEADDRWWLPLLWVLLVAMLLYAPFPTQRRYLLGVQTPLAVLAAYGWTRAFLPRISAGRRPLLTGVYVTLTALAPALLIFANINAFAHPQMPATTAVYYSADELIGYEWLRGQANPDDLVLTTFGWDGQGSGGRMVAALGQRVFMGHWIETTRFEEKIAQIASFYNPVVPDEWRLMFLQNNGARYVWYDDSARVLGGWNPADAPFLEQVFSSGSVTIYRVRLNG
ncbi:MAG: hypothetical protein HXY40_12175 [Chloroflexi bacterium]|nr:hypothetical protein [Chloroflexota bacterium]